MDSIDIYDFCRSSRRWEERIKNTKKARKRSYKTQKRLGTVSSHDSIPSSEEEFDKLLYRNENNLYYRGMRHRPDDEMNEFFDRERAKLSSSGSSYEYVSPEYIAKAEKWGPRCGQKPKEEGMVETILPMISDDEDSYSDDERQQERRRARKNKSKKSKSRSKRKKRKSKNEKGKQLYRRALSSSEESIDTERTRPTHRYRRENEPVEALPNNSNAKSWREIISEFGDTRKTLGSRLKNMKKVKYHIALNNEHEFVVMIVGMLMHMEFLDFEGQNYGRVSDGLQGLLGAPIGRPTARVLLAPRKCQKDGLTMDNFYVAFDRIFVKHQ